MTIVSVTPEIALDEGFTYAGGLGVLEGDKFYAMARRGIDYVVITLLYREGYVDYSFSDELMPRPQPQPKEFLEKLVKVDSAGIRLRHRRVLIDFMEYRVGKARVVFIDPTSPMWAANLVDRVYIEKSLEDKFAKYVLLAKGAAEYITRIIGINNVEIIDLQEAYTALLPLVLRLEPRKYRLIIHTPGPWGHPSFPREFFEDEFGYSFISNPVILTELGLSMTGGGVVVSEKMMDVVSKVIPHHMHKVTYITNGVDEERWIHPAIAGARGIEELAAAKARAREELLGVITRYKQVNAGDRPIIAWNRRITKYKRPEFILDFIEEEQPRDAVFVLAGKAHPDDSYGLEVMRRMKQAALNYENVVFMPDYGIQLAKPIVAGSSVMVFTPFPGWEASGTSFMKGGLNATPALSSRDGAAVELIKDGENGWLFGSDVRELIDIGIDARARDINEKEYEDFVGKLKAIIKMYHDDKAGFLKVMMNARNSFIKSAPITNALAKYYPGKL
ncbi:MAG: glycogen/starch/alpha-glucan phosphorylase [Thermocladium sp.]|jgi:starch phosphorylase